MVDIQKEVAAKNKKVVIPFRLDCDNLFSLALWAWLIRTNVEGLTIRHSPASATADIAQGFVPIDLSGGLKPEEGSCFEALLALAEEEDRKALRPLAEHIALQEKGGWINLAAEVGTLGAQLTALRLEQHSDEKLYLWAQELFRAYHHYGCQRIFAESAVEGAEKFAGGRIVVLPEESAYGADRMALERSDFLLWTSGLTVGLGRSPRLSEPHLGDLLHTALAKLFGGDIPEGLRIEPGGSKIVWIAPRSRPFPISVLEFAQLLAEELDNAAR